MDDTLTLPVDITAPERRGLGEKTGHPFLGSEFSFLVAYKIWPLDLLLISGRNLQNRWIEGS